jgi:hypothetical protein
VTILLPAGLHLVACSSSTGPGGNDGTAPAAVTDLAVSSFTDTTATLRLSSGLTQLTELQVSYNLIEDLAPLLANTGLGEGDRVLVRKNPLSETALNDQITALVARGVSVQH